MAHQYSIYEAKAKLSELLRTVKKGGETIITERGVPIAKIIPFKKASSFEDRWKELVEKGVVIPAKSKGPFPKGIGIHRPGALKRFLADRD